jgi:hypothetical protein
MLQQFADKITYQISAQGPGSAKIAEDPNHIGNAGKHHAAIGHRFMEIERLAINFKGDIAEDIQIETSSSNNDII